MNNLTYLNWTLLSDALLLFTIRTFIHDHVLTLTTKDAPDKNHPDIVCPYLNGILSLVVVSCRSERFNTIRVLKFLSEYDATIN